MAISRTSTRQPASDLVAIIVDWGTDGSANNTDIDGNGIVNVDDLVEVIVNWGVCT